MNTRNILIPIDFTEKAMIGLSSGLKIARDINADITLFHALPKAEPENFRPSADMQSRDEDAKEYDHFMAELIAKRKAKLQEIIKNNSNEQNKLKAIVKIGKFEDALEEYITETKIDLIVMGTSGETTFNEWFSGNHAAITMRTSKVPVLVVKEESWVSKNGKILLMVDLKSYKEKTVKSIRDFSNMMGMKVIITHIMQNKDIIESDIQGKLEDFAKEHKFDNYSIEVFSKGKKSDLINAFRKKHDIDMVASISEGDSGLVRLFFGSDTEKMLNEINMPFMAISE